MNSIKNKYNELLVALKKDSLFENLQLASALVFVATLTLAQKSNSVVLLLFVFMSLFTVKISTFKLYKLPILFFTSVFILSLITLIYTSNMHEGKLVIERQLALLFLPLLFFTSFKMNRVKFQVILSVFFISIVIVSLYLLRVSYDKFLSSHVPLKDWFIKDHLYHAFARPVKMHATFLSLYLGLGIFVGFYCMLLRNPWWVKFFVFLSTLVLFITLALLSSRVVISSVLVILFLIYPFYTGNLRYKFIFIIAGVIISLISFFLLRESTFIKSRFVENIGDEIKLKPFLKADSTYNPVYGGETRADRWFCAIELIKEKPILGYGTGSEKDVLMMKYKKYNLQNAEINKYDAHNQYLAFAIKLGVFGLFCFIISILYALFVAVRSKNFLYLAFTLLFAVTCITENVLESNKGIFFYAFFNVLFCSFCLTQRDPSIKEKETIL